MMTKPGEKRILYYDFNFASEATTTTPFKHMDLSMYCQLMNILGGIPRDVDLITENPKCQCLMPPQGNTAIYPSS